MIRVGSKLKEERIRKKISLEEVAKAIKIRPSFLSAIEKGDYQKLPSSAYAVGFVRNYASFLGLPEKEILALFRREFDEEKYFKVLPEGLYKKEDFPIKRIKFQQTILVVFLIFLALLAYILFQYRYAIINPPLSLDLPKENSVISSKSVTVAGTTDSNATLYVNNSSVSLDKDGKFKKELDLFPGKSTIKIKAVNRFGKQTEIERRIEVKAIDIEQ
ncbi:MAG: helix-turn-helix domain-containing protein [Patescibacteria group bacterium]|nr:helix-turn-helix domain-containing protein [Patescibacteria group bacterium]